LVLTVLGSGAVFFSVKSAHCRDAFFERRERGKEDAVVAAALSVLLDGGDPCVDELTEPGLLAVDELVGAGSSRL